MSESRYKTSVTRSTSIEVCRAAEFWGFHPAGLLRVALTYAVETGRILGPLQWWSRYWELALKAQPKGAKVSYKLDLRPEVQAEIEKLAAEQGLKPWQLAEAAWAALSADVPVLARPREVLG